MFNSEIDNWDTNTSVFNERIIGRKQLLFLIEHENGEIFGYYHNTEIIEKYSYLKRQITDDKTFDFNLRSNGRLEKSMKFEIQNCQRGSLFLNEKSSDYLITLGNIWLYKQNKKNESHCDRDPMCDLSNYHGIQDALSGQFKLFPKRILIIQMN